MLCFFKKHVAWVLIILVVAVILASVSFLTNPVRKLALPDATAVLSMSMEQINEGTSVGITRVIYSEDIKTVLSALSGARKTLMQTVNDYPTQGNYLIVRLALEKEERKLCLYSQGDTYYVEEPYVGVYKYKSYRQTNEAIYKIYNDSLSATTLPLKPLTLNDIRQLARKGTNLVFGDFKAFHGADASSSFNYHIMVYGVEGGFRLIVHTDGARIDSANLESIWESGGSGIDIRYNDIDDFVASHPSTASGEKPGEETSLPIIAPVQLEPTPASWSNAQIVDVFLTSLDYASDDIIIFHGVFGLFVYDLNAQQLVRSLDLKPINCQQVQGSNACEVTVSTDGNIVQLHTMEENNIYVYTVSDNTLYEAPVQSIRDRFFTVPTETVVTFDAVGGYSYRAVKFETGECAYLYSADWTIGSLAYVRGDMATPLFELGED